MTAADVPARSGKDGAEAEATIAELGQVRGQLRTIPVAAIARNPAQPRRVFDEGTLRELGANIARTGLLQPVGVRPRDNGRYELIWGERRLRAVEAAGGATISAQVLEIDDATALRATIAENFVRQQLTLEEQVEGFRALMRQERLSVAEAAEVLGLQRQTIYRLLKIDEDPVLGPAVDEGQVTKSQAQELLPIRNAETKRFFIAAIQERRASGLAVPVSEIRQSVAALRDAGPPPGRPTPLPTAPPSATTGATTGASTPPDPPRAASVSGTTGATTTESPATAPAMDPSDPAGARYALIAEAARRRARTQLRQATGYLRELAPLFASHADDTAIRDGLTYLLVGLEATRSGEPWPEE